MPGSSCRGISRSFRFSARALNPVKLPVTSPLEFPDEPLGVVTTQAARHFKSTAIVVLAEDRTIALRQRHGTAVADDGRPFPHAPARHQAVAHVRIGGGECLRRGRRISLEK